MKVFKILSRKNKKSQYLVSLFFIANSDDEFHDSEKEFLQKFADAFGFQITDEIMDKYSHMDMNSLFEELNKLSLSQKEWLVITIFGMIHADNMVLEEELLLTKKFFTRMGISLESIKNIIEKGGYLY